MTLREYLAADLAAAKRRRPRLLSHLFPNVFAVTAYRVAHALGNRGAIVPARLISIIAQVLTGAELNWQAELGPGLFLEHPVGVVVAPGVVTGTNVSLGAAVLLGTTYGESHSRPTSGAPVIGSDVYIWAKASVIGPVRIGDGAIVGAHSLVLHDVPAGAVARGVPARSYRDGVPV